MRLVDHDKQQIYLKNIFLHLTIFITEYLLITQPLLT